MAAVTLAVVASDLEAEMLCGELRANGIECSYTKIGPGASLGAYVISNAGPTAVLVDETQLEEARAFLPADQ